MAFAQLPYIYIYIIYIYIGLYVSFIVDGGWREAWQRAAEWRQSNGIAGSLSHGGWPSSFILLILVILHPVFFLRLYLALCLLVDALRT